ncbi:P-selectin glycoprotein ligand 1 isoform X2 [Sceloporus undulatus]|nr:P-selectin glycoprotein ligand 1 isoform X2 [Sceloporus undulatus]XP_042297998.1 P-selectin glycoprotein ligand 1 isoform X2 [Sceloporus undulatus]
MASLWLALLLVLPSLLMGSSYKLPSLRFFIQDGAQEEEEEAARFPAEADALLPTQRRWEWKASGDEGHQINPLMARRKREESPGFKKSTIPTKEQAKKKPHVVGTTTRPPTLLKKMVQGKMTGPPPHEKAAQEVATVTPAMGNPLTPPKNSATSQAPGTSLKLGKVSIEAKIPKDGQHFVTKGHTPKVAPQGTSVTVRIGKEAITVASPEMGKVLKTTEHWPWLHDQTSASSQTSVVATTELPTAILKGGLVTAGPLMKSKGKLSWTTQALVDNSDASTAALKRGSTTARPTFEAKDGFNLKRAKASSTTLWLWLDDMSTASSQTLVDISDTSTATETPGFHTVKPSLKTKRKDSFLLTTNMAGPTTATTAPVKPPTAPATVVGKCLLALFMLALVAAIFIVITGVLAAMLWRQKQAYKMNQYNHTEMVCISSLLATEEAEEARGRPPQVKRVKMLRENGSEAEMDNLTLNSFLPDH